MNTEKPITKKQIEQFNAMRAALIEIWKGYQTTSQLRRNCEKECGLDYEEALEMAYENIQDLAKAAVKGVKESGKAIDKTKKP